MKTLKRMLTILSPTLALALSAGVGLGQAPSPVPGPGPAPAPGTARPADAAAEAKFAAADKDKSGTLEGAEIELWKADLVKIDINGDGKVSKEEYLAAARAGHIK